MTTAETSAEDDGGETPADDGGSDGGGEATALDEGGFGDLEAVCQEGDASGATEQGVTDTEIKVSTVSDKGFDGPQQGDVRHRRGVRRLVQRARRHPRPGDRR